MEAFKTFLDSLKSDEIPCINRTAKNFFLERIPFSMTVRLLDENDLSDIFALQQELAGKGTLRQNSKEQLRESLQRGVWIGIFDNERLEAYTAFEFELLDDNILLYLKATVKRGKILKGFQKLTIDLRRRLGGDLAAKSLIPFGGGYATCRGDNAVCVENLSRAGLHRLFTVKALYSASPEGDRDVFGYGDIFDLRELLLDKWHDKEIEF